MSQVCMKSVHTLKDCSSSIRIMMQSHHRHPLFPTHLLLDLLMIIESPRKERHSSLLDQENQTRRRSGCSIIFHCLWLIHFRCMIGKGIILDCKLHFMSFFQSPLGCLTSRRDTVWRETSHRLTHELRVFGKLVFFKQSLPVFNFVLIVSLVFSCSLLMQSTQEVDVILYVTDFYVHLPSFGCDSCSVRQSISEWETSTDFRLVSATTSFLWRWFCQFLLWQINCKSHLPYPWIINKSVLINCCHEKENRVS